MAALSRVRVRGYLVFIFHPDAPRESVLEAPDERCRLVGGNGCCEGTAGGAFGRIAGAGAQRRIHGLQYAVGVDNHDTDRDFFHQASEALLAHPQGVLGRFALGDSPAGGDVAADPRLGARP